MQNIEFCELQQAFEDVQKIISWYPKSLDALNVLPVIYIKLRDYEKAKNILFLILNLDPNHSDAKHNLKELIYFQK